MTAERWQRIESLFAEALAQPAQERSRFLDRVCGADNGLRRELESLLACDAPGERLVELPAAFTATPSVDPESELLGRRIGPYRVLRLIGRGGMGAVYLGVRDDDQYEKQVAIKLLNRGMDTDHMLSRFRQERQILANLEHPFIARLLDGGATEDGLPYLVMEYVDGVPITTYCAEKGLSIPERLRLFRLVCEAVQYAHQHLVVHRDIKPSNILTTQEGVPKLLDFGIAKVLDPGSSADAALTRSELRMFTPDYASPEQVKGLPISTASDIYSMGAVLYELLACQRPHRFSSESPTDMERAICEVEPVKPSLAGDKLSKRQLSGDLDNIVLTAMRKERQRRYASAAEFSEDIRRHMESLPVHAREDRWLYRTGKFVRRHRLGVAASLLVAASLIGGIVATTLQARRAERRFELARRLAKSVVADVQGPMAQLPGSTALRASMIRTVVTYLDSLALDAGSDPAFEMEVAAAYQNVAFVEGSPNTQNLGQTKAALSHYAKAIAIFERHLNDPDLKAMALEGLIGANIEVGDIEARTGNAAAGEARLQRMASIASEATARDRSVLIPNSRIYLYFRLGSAEFRRGAVGDALLHYRGALEIAKEWTAADHGVNARSTLRGAYIHVGRTQQHTGDLYGARGNYQAALRIVEEALRQPNATVYERSTLANAHYNLSRVLANPDELNLGNRDESISHARAAVEISESIATTDRQDVRARDTLAGTYGNLASILWQERPAEALEWYRKADAILAELTATEPANASYARDLAESRTGLGEVLLRLGRHSDALEILVPTLERARPLFAPASNEISWTGGISRIYRIAGNAFLGLGDQQRALEHYQQGLSVADEVLRRAPSSLYLQRHRADAFESLGRYFQALAKRRAERKAEARIWFQKSLAVWQDWIRRKVAAPYAAARQRQTLALIASLDRP